MRYTIITSLLFAALVQSGFALASEPVQGMNPMPMQPGQAMPMQGGHTMQMQTHMGHGVVNSIDMQHGMVNLTHGSINSLGWPGMTMDFRVKDPATLKNVKPGEKVNFGIVKEGPGKFVVTDVTPAN